MKKETEKPVQMEFESIVGEIDDREAFERRKQALAQRWFKMYRLQSHWKKKQTIADQYNKIALMQRSR